MTDIDYTYIPKEVANMTALVDTYMRWKTYIRDKDKRNYTHYHPSELGKCLRSQQYKHYIAKGYITCKEGTELDSRILRLFDKGHAMHARWQDYFSEIGVLRGYWRCKNSGCYLFNENGQFITVSNEEVIKIMKKGESRVYGLSSMVGVFRPTQCVCGCSDFYYEECSVISEELNVRGHCDLLLDCSSLADNRFEGVRYTYSKKFLPTDGIVVVDMKTIGTNAWKNQIQKNGPHFYYLIQLICYIHILDCKYGLLIYENKDNSEMAWFKVDRNDEWWAVICRQLKLMQEMANTTDSQGNRKPKLPPPRPDSKNSYECKNCEFRNICHKSSVWDRDDLENLRRDFYKCLLN